MASESQYSSMKALTPEIKQLFQSRRYIQCANLCERLLSRPSDEIHPVHRATLHFYYALVHDTMARETTFKHRAAGFSLAEQHYRSAIDILSPSEPYNLDDLLTPFSDAPGDFRRWSNTSARSTASSALSSSSSSSSSSDRNHSKPLERADSPHSDDALLAPPPPAYSVRANGPGKRRPTSIMTLTPEQAHHEACFATELRAFVALVQAHLQSIQELRAAPAPWVRSRPSSRGSESDGERELERGRWSRRELCFRPRFDPEGVRRLCDEALAEL